jgi:hypothetical protein
VCWYTRSVTTTSGCPMRSLTTLTGSPAASAAVAYECRRSCSRIGRQRRRGDERLKPAGEHPRVDWLAGGLNHDEPGVRPDGAHRDALNGLRGAPEPERGDRRRVEWIDPRSRGGRPPGLG